MVTMIELGHFNSEYFLDVFVLFLFERFTQLCSGLLPVLHAGIIPGHNRRTILGTGDPTQLHARALPAILSLWLFSIWSF